MSTSINTGARAPISSPSAPRRSSTLDSPSGSPAAGPRVPELVLALDVATEADAVGLVDRCSGVRWVKVGPVLFTTAGPSLIERLKARGLAVFLDLKWHDIPNTVRGAVERARELGVDLVTVHALGGRAML